MRQLVDFYEKLPRGPAPPIQPKGLIERYLVRYTWGDNASKWRMSLHHLLLMPFVIFTINLIVPVADCVSLAIIHVVAALTLLGYAQHYYFHFSKQYLLYGFSNL